VREGSLGELWRLAGGGGEEEEKQGTSSGWCAGAEENQARGRKEERIVEVQACSTCPCPGDLHQKPEFDQLKFLCNAVEL
jgi:hypothetical protein